MSLGDKIFTGAIWSGFERLSSQALNFLIGLILARLLTPTEYGIIGIISVFIVISQVFVDSGFTKALIQKKDRDKHDISTVFYFNLITSILCCLLLWFAAPLIAQFYEIPLLELLLRVMSITLILNALHTVPATLLAIDLNFKTSAKVYITSLLISGSIAIGLAYNGYGVWALVWQALIRSVVMVIGMYIGTGWRPLWLFSKSSFEKLFSYGSRLLASSLLINISTKISDLLIGKYIGARDLGLYSRGVQFANFTFGALSSTIGSVFLPSLAPYQDDYPLLVKQTKKIYKIVSIIAIPIFLILTVLAEPLIMVLLTEKWIKTVPIMQIFCISRLITILSSININLLFVIGKTDLVLKQEYFKITTRLALILAALKFGIFYVACAELLATIIHFFINSYYPGKIMKFGAWKQLRSIFLLVLSGLISIVPSILFIQFLSEDLWILGLSIITLPALYFLCMKIFRIEEFDYLLRKVTSKL